MYKISQQQLLQKVKYHWHLYIAAGGFYAPKLNVGRLKKGGIEHWAKFLQCGREYVVKYPNDTLSFVPRPMINLLTGA